MSNFDVIVIGGGHAGCEAAFASAKMGCRTALVTLNRDRIGYMSCNPAIGGLAKGQLAKEIDAMGGLMGRITDRAAIQYRILNASKGPAVRASRAQCDKDAYARAMQAFLAGVPNLDIVGFEATDLVLEDGRVTGIELKDGSRVSAKAVVITAGTFMRAVMHRGEVQEEGGRIGDQAAVGLSLALERLGLRLLRLKTGTPPRLHRKSIRWEGLEPQPGDEVPRPFSFFHRPHPFPHLKQVSCHITYTNSQTHEIIQENLGKSPMFSGAITGVGPRYCPSIEDKVSRFAHRDRHQIFLEPEGLDVDEIYVNGISTSLPGDVQERFVHSIRGLEDAQFIRYGYAVEYDSVDPRQLRASLETKDTEGLFLAGQVNGTSGYEEAGAQGLIAGINAALKAKGGDPYVMSRLDGYTGVLVDDLVVKGTDDEPYRMFSSRAEYRLLLREDNVVLRLSGQAHRLGLLSDQEFRQVETLEREISAHREGLRSFFLLPRPETNEFLEKQGMNPLKDRVSGESLLKRPEVNWEILCELGYPGQETTREALEQVEIQVKYEGYIKRDMEILEGVRKNEGLRIPGDLDFGSIAGLSNEVKAKLTKVRPETIGQASRVPGITPAAVANLMIALRMRERRGTPQSAEKGAL